MNSATSGLGLEQRQLEALATLLAAHEDTSKTWEVLRRWNQNDPLAFAITAIQHLSTSDHGLGAKYLAEVLIASQTCCECLIDPELFGLSQIAKVIDLFAAVDQEGTVFRCPVRRAVLPRFHLRLTAAADVNGTGEAVVRALQIVQRLKKETLLVSWVQKNTKHPDSRVRQLTAKILCGFYKDTQTVGKHGRSSDKRIRANAIEALWGLDTPASRDILTEAIGDSYHRVVVNALVGLLLLGDPVEEQLHALSWHKSFAFRTAAAWGMGESRANAFRVRLTEMQSDTALKVREAAKAALERLERPA